MATPGDSGESEQNEQRPGFNTSESMERTEQTTEMAQEAEEEVVAEETGLPVSSSSEQQEPGQTGPVVRKSATNDSGNNGYPFPEAKRVRTAPAIAAKRPQLGLRHSTLLSGRKNRMQPTRVYSSFRQDSFEYKFGAMAEEDSDTSSSSEDEDHEETLEEAAEAAERPLDAGAVDPNNNEERRRFLIGNDYFRTKGKVSRRDGRLKISINETANSGYLARTLGQSVRNHLDVPSAEKRSDEPKKKQADEVESIVSSLHKIPRPKLNIVIMVIGSRGDIQPFLRIGSILSEEYGHRVRVASHPVFREFVEKIGLEFFDVGGDPSELMAFMVKNPGLIPNMQTVREGEIGRRRDAMGVMFEGFWNACISDSDDNKSGFSMSPFVVDAIIANPPSMAHVHIAERLGVPLHIMFTFPYSPTTQFPHPLANIKMRKSNVDGGYVNFMSYPLVEMMTWQGLGDIVNRFREKTLKLEPVSSLWAPGALYRMKVPYTYMWSPTLVPKPLDWGPEIDISGFAFLNLAKGYDPPKDLADFLDAGEPPVYIGFGSIVVDDPNSFTEMILKAVEIAGVRALVSKGWGGLGRGNDDTPKNVFMLGNIPHDWLFPRVKAVVHHGGAGTTAIGLKCARPTMIVPFFGDQPFWGNMVAEARAGAFECIPYKHLTAERLAEGIKQCLTEEAQQNVQKIADAIEREGDGAENAVRKFLHTLPWTGKQSMRCAILRDRVAVWKVRNSRLRLSALAAELLHKAGKFKWEELKLLRHYQWNDFDGPGEPITGSIGVMTESLYGIGHGFGMVPVRIARHIRERERHERKKRERQKRRQERERQKAGLPKQLENGENGENGKRPVPVRGETANTLNSTLSPDPAEPLSVEVMEDLNWGLKRTGTAILTMPNDLQVAIAQGLHNAPRLWGDATIRKPFRIKGFKSGWTAARREFAYGIYDGWTGLVKQPMGDWEDGETLSAKFAGLGTGIGKGIGGFVFKNFNALWAPPAFLLKGLMRHMDKGSDWESSKSRIRRSRIVQGENDLQELQKDESKHEELREIKEVVEHGWAVYEDIFNTAQEQFGMVGFGNVVGKYKMKQERRRWDVNSELEDLDIAQHLLKARKDRGESDGVTEKVEEGEAQRPPPSGLSNQTTPSIRLERDNSKLLDLAASLPEGDILSGVESETPAIVTPGRPDTDDWKGPPRPVVSTIGNGSVDLRPLDEQPGERLTGVVSVS